MPSVCFDDKEAGFESLDVQTRDGGTGELTAEMERAGAWGFHAGPRPASSATVVRAAGGDVSMSDGPYAEAKEQRGRGPARSSSLQLSVSVSRS